MTLVARTLYVALTLIGCDSAIMACERCPYLCVVLFLWAFLFCEELYILQ